MFGSIRSLRTSFFPQKIQVKKVSAPNPLYKSRTAKVLGQRQVSVQAASEPWICRECGYIYMDKTPFEQLPNSFRCPVCNVPKSRFRPYSGKATRSMNTDAVRKQRKEQLNQDRELDSIATPLIIGILVVVLGLLVGLAQLQQ